MSGAEETIQALREALRFSPDNLPLRKHFAETLLKADRFEEAEREYREVLARRPDDPDLKLGLASAFDRQGKSSHALVIVEELSRRTDASARAILLYARLLADTGDLVNSAAQYRKAIEADPGLADPKLALRLDLPATDPWVHPFGADEGEEVEGRVRRSWDDPGGESEVEIERPVIAFKDVGGMEAIKEEIRLKIILPLSHPELYKAYGKTVGGGILLYGPPGCGKTHLARAAAGEIQACFLSVGISEILDMWIGNSEKNLHILFEQARANKPCVLFFDEVDALAARRSDLRGSSGARQLVNQFLAETDGLEGSNEGILILAATNAPWHLDPAFRRPGRFDRVLFVPPPDLSARASILRILCRDKPTRSIDFDRLAKKTDHFSGADLKAVVDVAVEAKLREALKSGSLQPLSTKDLDAAATALRPSTREWFSTARNYALYSNQDGSYDDVRKYLKI